MRYLLLFVMVILSACAIRPEPLSPTRPAQASLPPAVASPATPAELPARSTDSAAAQIPTSASLSATQAPSAEPTVKAAPTLAAPTFPDPAQYDWKPIASGLERPVGISHAGDGSGRLFILEQPGRIRVFTNGELAAEPLLNIVDRVGSSGNEQGLLGLAFHPDFENNGFFFVNYTDLRGDTVIARFNLLNGQSDTADPNSEMEILAIPQPYPNHNGGAMAFGPDGYLYLGLGDGGWAGDPQDNAENPRNLLGKILRLDVDHGAPYQTPTDNLFIEDQRPEVWAYGLRNPWRFSFDRQTGDLYIGDVGQNQWEEIDYLPAGSPAGANFGWDFMEGSHGFEDNAPAGWVQVKPIAEYSHEYGCSVTGGVVYRGSALPAWNGIYLFGDYCSGNIWGLFQNDQGMWQTTLLYKNIGRIASFGEDEPGEIYAADLNGVILKLETK